MMGEFTLDTSGVVLTGNLCPHPTSGVGFEWSDLSPLGQGYGLSMAQELYERLIREGKTPAAAEVMVAFWNWAPETLAAIRKDCAAFRLGDRGVYSLDENSAGRAFWAMRQSKIGVPGFPPLVPCLGDDGKVCLRVEVSA